MNKTLSFKTSGLSGDIIHQMAGIKQVCSDLNAKADIFVWLDRPCFLYEGAEHPYGNVMMNQYAFHMMKPLIEHQPYVNSFQFWKGQDIMIDLDTIREVKVNLPNGSLTRWPFYKFPDMTADISKPWLEAGIQFEESEKILINITSRYRNPFISYFFMERYRPNVFFVGLKEEHETFMKDNCFDLPYLKVKDFHELADHISECKLFIGNQSMCFAIAEALKVPRVLEICQYAPNVIPTGPNGYDFTKQEALTYFVDKLTK